MRPRSPLPLVWLALAALLLPGSAHTAATEDPARFIAAFLAQRLDPPGAIHVEGVTITRGPARFTLERGAVTFTAPIEGRVCAAVYSGAGSFSLTPPTRFERNQLGRVLKTLALERRIRALVLIYADSTGDELTRARQRGDAPAPDAQEHLDWYLQSLGEPHELWLERALAQPFLDGARTGLLYAEVICEDDERLFLEIDPTAYEECVLARVARGPFLVAGTLRERETVCRFPLGGAYDTLAFGTLRPDLQPLAYRIDVRIGSGLGLSAVAEVDTRAEVDGATWIPLQLEPRLTVDSVAWVGEGPAAFLRRPDNSMLWVRAGSPTVRGEPRTLRVGYHGAYIESAGEWLYLRENTGWYPRPRAWLRSTFDLTFHHPSSLHLTCVGEQVESDTRDRVTTSRWRVRRPTGSATFTLGNFREQSFGTAETPPVQALMFEGKPNRVQWNLEGTEITAGSRLEEWVAKEAADCVAFYQGRFGPAQVPGFVVTQIPALHGEAFPGLINIPETSFNGPNAPAEDAVFRAHEVAHQWWGYSVEGGTYHDHWLTEGFADFSALWYLQAGLKRNQDYLALLADWSRTLADDQQMRPERGRLPGPIWLGYRNSTRNRPYDYVLMDYKKGAWVLHMLRTLMIDLDTMDDARFEALMRDFYRAYAGTSATTADFQRVAEHHMGQDLDWFFDEWVYDTGIPTFEFATRATRTDGGGARCAAACARKASRTDSRCRW